jgi:hypothetical protein
VPACSPICEIHADLSPGGRCHTVLLRPKRTRLPTMSTIELVDPELRDALALWPRLSLTAETLTRRRADALALLSSVSTPDLPDIATGEIHIESGFGAKPIRVLTYRPVRVSGREADRRTNSELVSPCDRATLCHPSYTSTAAAS